MDLLPADILPFDEERECDYKGEHYSVRDNGVVMRHVHNGEKARKYDNVWTLGTRKASDGYLYVSNHRVHVIVATAFHGEHDSTKFVVDHIDTNRCNNRAENLRWLTRLENVLNNPVTLKRITYLCGGDIQKFIDNPSCLRDLTGSNQDLMWMRTVSAEEARNAYERIMSWAALPSSATPSKGGKMGEWIYSSSAPQSWQPDFSNRDKPNEPSKEAEQAPKAMTVKDLRLTSDRPIVVQDTFFDRAMLYDVDGNPIGPEPTRKEKRELRESNLPGYFETSNKLAQYIGWKPNTKPEFLCCPTEVSENPLQEYADRLIEGADFVVPVYGPSIVYKHIIDHNQLLVITRIPNGVKNFGLARVTWNGKVFIHESIGTYFEENGVMAAFTRAQGKEWTGGDSIDFYC
ncbi:MAG: HNH endonuclease [Paludibacteraceae bacterium]|nr:HNH endonuclease [Paludibacteraceae bacterium]